MKDAGCNPSLLLGLKDALHASSIKASFNFYTRASASCPLRLSTCRAVQAVSCLCRIAVMPGCFNLSNVLQHTRQVDGLAHVPCIFPHVKFCDAFSEQMLGRLQACRRDCMSSQSATLTRAVLR